MSTDDLPTAVYRFYDDAGELLYVGITCRPRFRFREHRKLSEWWSQQRSVTLAWRPDRNTAAADELTAIREEKPRYNVAGRYPVRPSRYAKRRLWPPTDLRGAVAADVRAEIGRAGTPKSEIRALLGLATPTLCLRLRGDVAFRREELANLAAHLGIPIERFSASAAHFAFTEAGAA